jgi:hypothetical protein
MSRRIRRVLFAASNVVGGAVLVLLFLDPRRDLTLIFVLLAVGLLLWLPAMFFRPKKGK